MAIRHDGKQVAVGLQDGAIFVFSTTPSDDGGTELVVELAPPTASVSGDLSVRSLCFSPDGSLLAAGRQTLDDFSVYDMAASAAVVHRFVRPKSGGRSLAFVGGESDLLVVGGGVPGTYAVRALQPPRADRTFTLPGSTAEAEDVGTGSADMVADEENGVGLVAMTAGSQLEVVGTDGVVRVSKDLGITIAATVGLCAVKLQPGGRLVACVLGAGKAGVAVLSVADGSEAFRIQCRSSAIGDIAWSPDGMLLAIGTARGVEVRDVARTGAEVCWLHEGELSICCAFDRSCWRLATGSNTSGCVTVWDVATWERTQTLPKEDSQFTQSATAQMATASRTL